MQYWEHFLATEILWHKDCVPRRTHDLESFLWVMIYICINYRGPYGQRSVPPVGTPGWLLPGRLPQHRSEICKERLGVQDWISTCSIYFAPYFNHPVIVVGLGFIASKLSPASLKTSSEGSQSPSFSESPDLYDYMILVLQHIIENLPVEEPPSEDVVQKARETYRHRQNLSSEKKSKNGCNNTVE